MKRSRGTTYFATGDILRIVKEIRQVVESNEYPTENTRREVLEKRYPEFATRHAHLFTMACETNFDMDRLEFMLNLRDKVENKKVTFEDASKTVGQVMFDSYIKDKVPPPPSQ